MGRNKRGSSGASRRRKGKDRRKKLSKNQKKKILTEVLQQIQSTKSRIRDSSFNYSKDDNTYATLETDVFQKKDDFVQPEAGSVLKPGSSVTFKISTGPNEFIKLKDLPIQVSYRVKFNQTVDNTSTDLSKKVAQIALNLHNNKDLFLNPIPGVTGFFESAQVTINGRVITDMINLGPHADLYKSFNQRIATHQDQMRSKTLNYVKTITDRTSGTTNTDAAKPAYTTLPSPGVLEGQRLIFPPITSS